MAAFYYFQGDILVIGDHDMTTSSMLAYYMSILDLYHLFYSE